MERLAVLALLLTGCAAAPERENPWLIDPLDAVAPRPIDLPDRPTAEACGDRVCFSLEGADTLLLIDALARENTALAEDLADALEASERAQNGLVEAGLAEYQLSELRARMLAEERLQHRFSQAGLAALALLGVLLAD